MASAQDQPARSWCPLKTTPTGEGWGFRFFMKGDGQKTHSRAEKKDHENKYKKTNRAREQIRTVEQHKHQHTESSGRSCANGEERQSLAD